MSAKRGVEPGAHLAIRLTLGFLYLHFGLLKFFPDLSPAELIAGQTVARLSLDWIGLRAAMTWLAVLECAIGLGMLFNFFRRGVFYLFVFHISGTLLPLLYLPELTFKVAPLAPTLDGQYILKNLVLLAAGWAVLAPEFAARGEGRASRHADVRHGLLAPGAGREVKS